ncbi:hypothetical protein Salat_0941500 [Sesamum alatum]|uniref:Prolamin-like domain-containing protein n=1 Tax=Sesamum alatum TaxID=300844 RepID=A0AAE2CRR3_9LAMI|nr:hypothetical protein Salat_0941500 [Sesamum alatum]
MSKPSLIHALVFIACTSALATSGLAHLLDNLGFLGGGGGVVKVNQCLNVVLGVRGCLRELIFYVLSLQPRLLDPACCKAFLQIDEGCWPKVFPLNSASLPSVESYCTGIQGRSQTPPPPCTTTDGEDSDSTEEGGGDGDGDDDDDDDDSG